MPTTTTDLYRRGNASGPRMTNLRAGKDIDVLQIDGVDWVEAHSGGVSTFSEQRPGTNWWCLPAGSDFPGELAVVNDHGDHYNWEPSVDMTLTEFVALLQDVEAAFYKVS